MKLMSNMDMLYKNIAEYLGVHYVTINRAVKKVEEKHKK
jgi:transposase